MNLKLVTLALAGCALSGQASAQISSCAGGSRVTNSAATQTLTNALRNNTVCASRNGERWQEWHKPGAQATGTASGRIEDYKRGPGHPVDPTTDVGSWSISNNIVTYNYGTGGTYSYALFRDSASGPYHFCGVSGTSNNGNNIPNATIRPGQVPCN